MSRTARVGRISTSKPATGERSEVVEVPARREMTSIAVSMDREFKTRVEAAARRYPGGPTTATFVRIVLDKYLSAQDASVSGE